MARRPPRRHVVIAVHVLRVAGEVVLVGVVLLGGLVHDVVWFGVGRRFVLWQSRGVFSPTSWSFRGARLACDLSAALESVSPSRKTFTRAADSLSRFVFQLSLVTNKVTDIRQLSAASSLSSPNPPGRKTDLARSAA